LAPPEVLLMSSSPEQKVSWALFRGSEAAEGVVRPLIDAGLVDPRGLAYHAGTGALFVADVGQGSIFRYILEAVPCSRAKCGGVGVELRVDGTQVLIVEDVQAPYVAVDAAGDLFFTDQRRNLVCRIQSETIQRLAHTNMAAADLQYVPVQQVPPWSRASGRPQIILLYRGDVLPLVRVPAGIDSDGVRVAWSNVEPEHSAAYAGGGGAPSVALASAAAYPMNVDNHVEARMLSASTGTFGDVLLTNMMALYTAADADIFGVCQRDGRTVLVSDGLGEPRGLAWGGAGTAYVADSAASAVYSFPVGSCHDDLPLRRVASFHGVFGLAVIRAPDLARSGAFDDGSTWASYFLDAAQ